MTVLRRPLVPLVVAAGACLLLAGCGQGQASDPGAVPPAEASEPSATEPAEPADPGTDPTGPALLRDGEPLVLCGLAEPCPASALRDVGNLPVPRQVLLTAPLGGRALLDGRTWPPLLVASADG